MTPTFHKKSGLWMPWNEARPDKMISALEKYQHDVDFLFDLLPKKAKKRSCVQAGGHIGVWPIMLSNRFRDVYTFEADPPVFAALALNVARYDNITATQAALGAKPGRAEFSYYSARTAVSTMAEIQREGDLTTEVTVIAIDELGLDVAAIVLDVEGYEPKVLEGARETIARCRPYVMCEMLPKSKDEIIRMLATMGYHPLDNPRNRKCRDVVFHGG